MKPAAALSTTLRRVAFVAVVSAVAGGLYGHSLGDGPRGALTGAATGGLLSYLEVFVLGRAARRRLARLPFGLYVALRLAIYVAAIIAVDVLISRASGHAFFGDELSRNGLAFALGMSAAVNLLFGVNDLLGPGVLFAFVLGRYRRPRREERVVLYLDLCGSTALAERLSDERFLDFVNAFFADVTVEAEAQGGEIHKYVGDELIATWPADTPPERPIRAWRAMASRLAAREGAYLAEFGTAPRFRAAIHKGPVVIGELGERKKEIALIGDAMNTAARILDAARENGAAALISAAYFDVSGEPGLRLPPTPVRGKSVPLELISLSASVAS